VLDGIEKGNAVVLVAALPVISSGIRAVKEEMEHVVRFLDSFEDADEGMPSGRFA
jgi:hypothetical protein